MGPGRALDAAAVKAVTALLGRAPGDVQIHTGPEAQRFVAQHGALAVTIANHIAFGAGQYRPGTPDGDGMIAHEIAHVIQMRDVDPGRLVGRAEGEADDRDSLDDAGSPAVGARRIPRQ